MIEVGGTVAYEGKTYRVIDLNDNDEPSVIWAVGQDNGLLYGFLEEEVVKISPEAYIDL